jgi:hypothetical protein
VPSLAGNDLSVERPLLVLARALVAGPVLVQRHVDGLITSGVLQPALRMV